MRNTQAGVKVGKHGCDEGWSVPRVAVPRREVDRVSAVLVVKRGSRFLGVGLLALGSLRCGPHNTIVGAGGACSNAPCAGDAGALGGGGGSSHGGSGAVAGALGSSGGVAGSLGGSGPTGSRSGGTLALTPAQVAAIATEACAGTTQEVATCVFAIPSPPAGQTFDPNTMNVIVTAADGSGTLVLESNQPGCTEGWQFDTPTIVSLCPVTCDAAKASGTQVILVFGCAGVPLPR